MQISSMHVIENHTDYLLTLCILQAIYKDPFQYLR